MITLNLNEAQAKDLLDILSTLCPATSGVNEATTQLTKQLSKAMSFDECTAWRQYEALSVVMAGLQVGELMAGTNTKNQNS